MQKEGKQIGGQTLRIPWKPRSRKGSGERSVDDKQGPMVGRRAASRQQVWNEWHVSPQQVLQRCGKRCAEEVDQSTLHKCSAHRTSLRFIEFQHRGPLSLPFKVNAGCGTSLHDHAQPWNEGCGGWRINKERTLLAKLLCDGLSCWVGSYLSEV